MGSSAVVTEANFVNLLLNAAPELQSVVNEHLKANGDLLLHLLMGDIRLFAVAAFEAGEGEELDRILAFLDTALIEGDDRVNNAVALSFVEDSQVWALSSQAFISSWLPALRTEAERQRNWRAPEATKGKPHG